MTTWSEADPGAGDLDGILRRAAALTDRVEHASDMTITLRTCRGHMSEFWSGTGCGAWTTSAHVAESTWSALESWCEASRRALRRYASDVESIHARASRHRASIEAATDELAALTASAPLLDPLLVSTRTADHEDAIAFATTAIARLALERQEADDTLVAAIRGARQDAGLPHRHAGVPSAGDLSSLGPLGLLAELSALSATELARALASEPALADRIHAMDPTVVAEWWSSLDGPAPSGDGRREPSPTQQALIDGIPAVIGNLDGVAYWARDRANHVTLDRELARLTCDPAAGPDGLAALAALLAVEKTLKQGMAMKPPRELVSLSIDGKPKAAISLGDLDTAEHISYAIPGMGTEVGGSIGSYASAAADLLETQSRVSRLEESHLAVVAWLDYDAPGPADVVGVANDKLAEAGALRLASALHGLDAVRDQSRHSADVSVVGHSYGTNVATLALTRAHADHVVLLGSAGISQGIADSHSLFVPPGEVFASQGRHDAWASIGQAISGRTDPTGAAFDARPFNAEDGIDERGRPLEAVTQHGPLADAKVPDSYSYLDANTSAQFNTAKATMGQGSSLAVADTPFDRLELQAEDRLRDAEQIALDMAERLRP